MCARVFSDCTVYLSTCLSRSLIPSLETRSLTQYKLKWVKKCNKQARKTTSRRKSRAISIGDSKEKFLNASKIRFRIVRLAAASQDGASRILRGFDFSKAKVKIQRPSQIITRTDARKLKY